MGHGGPSQPNSDSLGPMPGVLSGSTAGDLLNSRLRAPLAHVQEHMGYEQQIQLCDDSSQTYQGCWMSIRGHSKNVGNSHHWVLGPLEAMALHARSSGCGRQELGV